MPRYTLENSTAGHVLAAVKGALGHLSTLRMQAVELGTSDPDQLVPVYRHVRKLREYLQRANESFQDQVDLELTIEDADRLAACFVREIDALETEIEDSEPAPESRSWMTERITILRDLTIEMASKPIRELPRRAGRISTTARNTLLDVRKKFGPDQSDSTSYYTGMQGGSAGITAMSPFADSTPTRTPNSVPSAIAPEVVPVESTSSDGPILEVRLFRDPRLRCAAQLDVAAFERASVAKDHRLAALHLYSILEAVVIDWAMPRARDLGLAGSPDTWTLESLVHALMPELSGRDRATLSTLSRCVNLVLPGRQLADPLVVTSAVLGDLASFVRRMLTAFGYSKAPSREAPAI